MMSRLCGGRASRHSSRLTAMMSCTFHGTGGVRLSRYRLQTGRGSCCSGARAAGSIRAIIDARADRCRRIPMREGARSLNLSMPSPRCLRGSGSARLSGVGVDGDLRADFVSADGGHRLEHSRQVPAAAVAAACADRPRRRARAGGSHTVGMGHRSGVAAHPVHRASALQRVAPRGPGALWKNRWGIASLSVDSSSPSLLPAGRRCTRFCPPCPWRPPARSAAPWDPPMPWLSRR